MRVMELSVARTAAGTEITPIGRFDAHECENFKEICESVLETTADVRVHLAAVDFIDSAGLAELVRLMRRTREGGGDTVLVRPSTAVRVILELTRLDAAFEVEWADDTLLA